MPRAKDIHFGRFVREKRLEKGLSLKEFAGEVGITEKRIWDIEQMAAPQINDRTLYGLARAAGMGVAEFEQAWQVTPVKKRPMRKAGAKPGRLRIIRVDSDTYVRLEHLAARTGITVEAYIAKHAQASTRKLIIQSSPPPGRSGGPVQEAAASGTDA